MSIRFEIMRRQTQIVQFLRKGYQSIMRETPMVDFKMRNLFSARIRIVIFLLNWISFFIFFPEIWLYAPGVPLLLNLSFLVTVYCYWNLLHEKMVFRMTVLAILADALGQSVLVYVLGYAGLAPFLIYGLYTIAAGVLFGFFMAILSAGLVVIVYLLMFGLVSSGLLHDFYYPGLGGGLVNLKQVQNYFAPLFLPVVLGFLVYAVRIANYFGQLKQKALERRHVQLAALNHIGSTIRKALKTDEVISQVLQGVVKGLRFETCFLVLLDQEQQVLRFYTQNQGYYTQKLQELLGEKISQWTLPVTADESQMGNAIRRSMDKGRVVIRNHFSDIVLGVEPKITFDKSVMAQSYLGIKKFVVTPLIAEQKAIGALIGVSISPYIEDTVIDTLENFSNQAALAIESAQLFERLQAKNQELTQANKVKSDFLAIMSHELRTPLFAVIGYSEILLDRILGDLSQEQKKSIVEILRNAKNLLELINNVLDLSKLESGKMDLNFESLDLGQLAQNVIKTLKPLIDKKHLRLDFKTKSGLPPLIADPIKIRQVFINLLGNAVKFTGEKGQIHLEIEYFPEGQNVGEPVLEAHSDFQALAGRAVFLVRIQDSGVGISEEDQRIIFETFRQADNSFTRAHEGTGLGLALTKQLVLLHSGLIAVKSQLGQGSEFLVLLPQMALRKE